jgi:hypothetical protein
MHRGSRSVLVTVGVAALVAVSVPAAAQQTDARPFIDAQTMVLGPPLPPATLLEGFRAPIGAVVTVGHEVLGDVRGVSVEIRELRDSTGGRVRGLVINVNPDKGSLQWSDIDEDEVPLLLKGIDQLLPITGNPTQFGNFEMRYATKGELEVTASSSRNRGVVFSVEAGRFGKARRDGLTAGEMQQLRTLIEAASQKLATMPLDK